MSVTGKVVMRCQQKDCMLPWLTVINGTVVVVARHNGDKHTNVIALETLIKFAVATGVLTHAKLEEMVATVGVYNASAEEVL